jgi:hypothetical protein
MLLDWVVIDSSIRPRGTDPAMQTRVMQSASGRISIRWPGRHDSSIQIQAHVFAITPKRPRPLASYCEVGFSMRQAKSLSESTVDRPRSAPMHPWNEVIRLCLCRSMHKTVITYMDA